MAGKAAEKPQYNGQNLKRDFTREELAENGRKGGVASGVAKRRQRTFRESIKAIMACPVPDDEQRDRLEQLGVDATMLNAIHMAINERAMRGDVDAARYLRDTAGEKPREGVDLDISDRPLESLDLSKLTDEQLQALAAQRAGQE